jgi:uncharacterized protein (TIGR02145 family)
MVITNKTWLFKFMITGSIVSWAVLLPGCEKESKLPVDGDGNEYDTVVIGTQVWLWENLKTTKYNDGTAIPNLTEYTEWINFTKGAYCWYNNDISYKTPYGALYNWYAVNTGKLCPEGWHVPTDSEWTKLITYLGGENVAGGKLKESGTGHWAVPNIGATNESGFAALPGGGGGGIGSFSGLTYTGEWWNSDVNEDEAWFLEIYYNSRYIYKNEGTRYRGHSVRCIKN